MLIVTAGHIDHGKTTLVRALTGTDTDRLPQEKERGISIDLGFAYWQPEGGGLVGFVDVPGHERYVRNMLAGLSGADFALLVVAADDGVMPQTSEHLRMLDLMGLRRGVAVLTKCDRVDAARLEAVRQDVDSLLAKTGRAGSPILPVSSVTGRGIANLKQALSDAACDPQRPGGAARFAIDRCFTISGAGTVVTGTLLAGSLAQGDQLILSPSGLPIRVRGLQCAGLPAESAHARARCAVNLAGAAVGQIHRGDWLVDPELHAPTVRIEARVTVEADRKTPLRHGTALRLYLGADEIPARMLSRRQMPIAPGESAVVAMALDHSTIVVSGDRFVLRDASGVSLIGGGRIVDPYPPSRFRREDGREAIIAALELHDPRASLEALLASDGAEIDCRWFARSFGLSSAEAQTLFAQAGASMLGKARPVVLSPRRLASLEEEVLGLLARWHHERPEAGGMSARDIGKALTTRLSAGTLAAILRGLADGQRLEFAGPLLRMPGHQRSFSPAETILWAALCDWLENGPPRTVTSAELAEQLRESERSTRTMLLRRRIAGDLWAIDESRFMLPAHVAMLAASAGLLAQRHASGFSAAHFRNATGIGRNHVIRLLEFFDRIGASQRRGEIRVMREGWQELVGEAAPWLAGEA